jgi:hypothetical protein
MMSPFEANVRLCSFSLSDLENQQTVNAALDLFREWCRLKEDDPPMIESQPKRKISKRSRQGEGRPLGRNGGSRKVGSL